MSVLWKNSKFGLHLDRPLLNSGKNSFLEILAIDSCSPPTVKRLFPFYEHFSSRGFTAWTCPDRVGAIDDQLIQEADFVCLLEVMFTACSCKPRC